MISHWKRGQVWEAERQKVRSDAAEALATEQAVLKQEAAAEQARLKGQLEGMQKELNDILNDRCVRSSFFILVGAVAGGVRDCGGGSGLTAA
jgi:hypothetical protein